MDGVSRLISRLRDQGLSYSEIGALLGAHRANVHKLESGERPGSRLLNVLAAALLEAMESRGAGALSILLERARASQDES